MLPLNLVNLISHSASISVLAGLFQTISSYFQVLLYVFFFFFSFLIDHMVFHRSSTCITPFFESIKWYFWLIRPLWTTSARLISTCPKDSYIKKKKKERIRLGQRFNFLCRRIHCRSFIKRIKTNKIEVGITYII